MQQKGQGFTQLVSQNYYSQVEKKLREILALTSDGVDSLCLQAKYEEIRAVARKVASINSLEPEQLLGLALIFAGFLLNEEAIHVYRRNIAKQPDHWKSRYGLGMMLLLLGNFEEGFQEYEHRVKMFPNTLLSPRWKGEKIEGKTLLVLSEQGIGDTIQFARYIPLLNKYRCQVILQLPLSLKGLFEGVGFSVVYEGMMIPKHDVHVNLMSLPWIFKTDLSTIPPPICLKMHRCPIQNRVGIVWKGNPNHPLDKLRSIPLKQILLPIPDVQYVSLQKDVTPEELACLDANGVKQPLLQNWIDTVHVLETCERVICVDTSVAHLAGSMGIPTFALIPYAPDWRWMLDRTDSPWYPSMRLFRQSKLHSWKEPLDAIFLAIR